jgi:hypothetical protein
MQWTMPPRVLQLVAGLLSLVAVSSFAMGIVNAPQRGRLPGERHGDDGGAQIQAVDATPLDQERIEGTPPPPELTPEEKAKLEAERQAKEEAARLAAAETAARAAAPPQPILQIPQAQTDQLQPVEKTPPPEDVPF